MSINDSYNFFEKYQFGTQEFREAAEGLGEEESSVFAFDDANVSALSIENGEVIYNKANGEELTEEETAFLGLMNNLMDDKNFVTHLDIDSMGDISTEELQTYLSSISKGGNITLDSIVDSGKEYEPEEIENEYTYDYSTISGIKYGFVGLAEIQNLPPKEKADGTTSSDGTTAASSPSNTEAVVHNADAQETKDFMEKIPGALKELIEQDGVENVKYDETNKTLMYDLDGKTHKIILNNDGTWTHSTTNNNGNIVNTPYDKDGKEITAASIYEKLPTAIKEILGIDEENLETAKATSANSFTVTASDCSKNVSIDENGNYIIESFRNEQSSTSVTYDKDGNKLAQDKVSKTDAYTKTDHEEYDAEGNITVNTTTKEYTEKQEDGVVKEVKDNLTGETVVTYADGTTKTLDEDGNVIDTGIADETKAFADEIPANIGVNLDGAENLNYNKETNTLTYEKDGTKYTVVKNNDNTWTVTSDKDAVTKLYDANGNEIVADPADADPANADPANADPADADPADADPANADPADADPANADPANADPADADPADADPADADPADAGTEELPEDVTSFISQIPANIGINIEGATNVKYDAATNTLTYEKDGTVHTIVKNADNTWAVTTDEGTNSTTYDENGNVVEAKPEDIAAAEVVASAKELYASFPEAMKTTYQISEEELNSVTQNEDGSFSFERAGGKMTIYKEGENFVIIGEQDKQYRKMVHSASGAPLISDYTVEYQTHRLSTHCVLDEGGKVVESTITTEYTPPKEDNIAKRVVDNVNSETTITYTEGNYDIITQNSDGTTTTVKYNAQGNPTTTTKVYDTAQANGAVKEVVDHTSNTTTLTYADGSYEVITKNADGTTTTVKYDAQGNEMPAQEELKAEYIDTYVKYAEFMFRNYVYSDSYSNEDIVSALEQLSSLDAKTLSTIAQAYNNNFDYNTSSLPVFEEALDEIACWNEDLQETVAAIKGKLLEGANSEQEMKPLTEEDLHNIQELYATEILTPGYYFEGEESVNINEFLLSMSQEELKNFIERYDSKNGTGAFRALASGLMETGAAQEYEDAVLGVIDNAMEVEENKEMSNTDKAALAYASSIHSLYLAKDKEGLKDLIEGLPMGIVKAVIDTMKDEYSMDLNTIINDTKLSDLDKETLINYLDSAAASNETKNFTDEEIAALNADAFINATSGIDGTDAQVIKISLLLHKN